MTRTVKIESISQIHENLGYEKPKHPLITVIDYTKVNPALFHEDIHVITSFYSVTFKDGHECDVKYGRQYYDFQEGSLMFLAPGQSITVVGNPEKTDMQGWALFFHPDLIRKHHLGKHMQEYTFFSYDAYEALHLSDQEKQMITALVNTIEQEYSQNLDVYSQDLIVSHLEVLLNYCKRFYGRQFLTRTHVNKDVVSRFEEFIKGYFDSERPEIEGLPTVTYCAQEMGYSANYLSDLLKKETGKNTQEHIHFHVIERAKTLLLGTEEPVNVIAYSLGFEYPQHFSTLFKKKTGMSPVAYRQ
jgi:AraC-like DNA-binding protein